MTGRAGVEAEAVSRLTDDIAPGAIRAILVQCLGGELSTAVAIVRMLAISRDLPAVRGAVDDVTRRAGEISRAGDNLVRDRADSLTQLFVDNRKECAEIVEMLRAHPDQDPSADLLQWDGLANHLHQRPPV